jgi:hypothetical protein
MYENSSSSNSNIINKKNQHFNLSNHNITNKYNIH